jgi:hypothetical protein
MGGVKTYDPQQVSLSIGGQIASGFADGTFISVEPDEDTFTKVTGADGDVSRSKTANESATLTLTLAQTSPFNDILSALAAADKVSSTGVFPVIIKDNSGTTVVSSGAGWIRRLPTSGFGKEIENREWIIDMGKTIFFVGGNTDSDAA